MMKFKSVANKVTDERDEAVLNNKVAAECFYIMIVGTLVCLVYGSLFNNGVISADYLLYPLLISSIWSIYRAERLDVNAFGSSSITVLGCLLVTGLITLMITIGTTMMSIIIIPWILDISWLGQLLIPYMLPLFSL